MSTSFDRATQQYAEVGVEVESALNTLFATPVSIHCWQGDDVAGSENATGDLSGSGLATTGNYPGKARNPRELRQDLDKALSLIPGHNRINLHACYPDRVIPSRDRDAYEVDQFQDWIGWAKENQLGMDFNPSCFAHPKAAEGFTLTHPDPAIRAFWINHCKASRRIACAIGKELGRCINNLWIPDGMKDHPADRLSPRQRLLEALDEIFAESLDPDAMQDSVESKLFGIGSEAYVVGSHEFYLGYAITRQKILCLDAGHFHPTETLADKISSTLLYVPELLLHVSRGVRWDSDHVVLFDDPTKAVMEEIVRGGFLPRVSIGLDYFDASINRVAAWVIGTRNTQKALLQALLEPRELLADYERRGDYTARLALMEDCKTLPFSEVWEEFCNRSHTPGDRQWMQEVKDYEHAVLSHRN